MTHEVQVLNREIGGSLATESGRIKHSLLCFFIAAIFLMSLNTGTAYDIIELR